MKYFVKVYYQNYNVSLPNVSEKALKDVKEAFDNKDLHEYKYPEEKGRSIFLDFSHAICLEIDPVKELDVPVVAEEVKETDIKPQKEVKKKK